MFYFNPKRVPSTATSFYFYTLLKWPWPNTTTMIYDFKMYRIEIICVNRTCYHYFLFYSLYRLNIPSNTLFLMHQKYIHLLL